MGFGPNFGYSYMPRNYRFQGHMVYSDLGASAYTGASVYFLGADTYTLVVDNTFTHSFPGNYITSLVPGNRFKGMA